jgi:hypothetical protein
MKTAVSLFITALLIAVVVPVQASVCNVDLPAMDGSGFYGRATTIFGSISGVTPYANLEVNVRLNRAPSEDMVYEAWLVDTDSNYKLSLGAFDSNLFSGRRSLPAFSSTGPYDTLAISLEPANDSSPMPTKIIAQGNLPGDAVSAADFTRVAVLPPSEMFYRQLVMQRFNLTDDQITDLRVRGWGYSDIELIANAALKCNRSPGSIADMLAQGRSWSQIATDCNVTLVSLLEPMPIQAVAGYREEVPSTAVPPAGAVRVPIVYLRYPNGRAVVAQDMWDQLHKRGYSWQDVAAAANIAYLTGESMDNLLRMARIRGVTWRQMAIERGLNADRIMDVSLWPFSRNGEVEMMPPSPPSPPAMPSEIPY